MKKKRKHKVLATFPADHKACRKLKEEIPDLFRIRYYENKETGKKFKTIEILTSRGSPACVPFSDKKITK